MAANRVVILDLEETVNGVAAALTNAACEWFLIFLLFVDAALSYLAVKFARYCNLQAPCFLCSRLDLLFCKDKPDFYQSLLCTGHRSEISSLLSYQTRGNLADGCGMCDDCHFSFARTSKLIGRARLGQRVQPSFTNSIPDVRLCSCCNKPWQPWHKDKRLLQPRAFGNAVTKPNIPLPRRAGRRGGLKNTREKLVSKIKYAENRGNGDGMVHVGYKGIKVTSDSDSEFLFSDDDGLLRLDNESLGEFSDPSVIETPCRKLFEDDEVFMKMAPNSSDIEKPSTDPHEQHDKKHTTEYEKAGQVSFPELIQLDEIPQLSQNSNSTVPAQSFPLVDAFLPLNVLEVPDRTLSEKYANDSERGYASGDTHHEILDIYISTAGDAQSGEDVGEDMNAASRVSSPVTQSESCMIPSGAERELTESVAEQSSNEKHGIVDEDSDLSMPPHLAGERKYSTSQKACPNIETHSDEESLPVVTEGSSSNGFLIHKHPAPEESSDGSTVSDIEGEHIVDRLKRKIEQDKRRLRDLHKELEEERNASEIATNQAMAMITRLQEEKAALHMEASQYLRMMDEQAEHDMDALERANDMLAEKEKELQDLEVELEYFRVKFPDESFGEIPMKDDYDLSKASTITNNIPVDANGKDESSVMNASLPGFEDEKMYISHRLRSLKRMLDEFYDNRNSEDTEIGADNASLDNGCCMNQNIENDVKVQVDSIRNGHQICGEQKDFMNSKDNKQVFLENEISDLKERFETLNADGCFLQRIFHMLDNGKEGLQFVQEIAFQLQEIRNLGVTKICQPES